jgi:electron transport complex protein RnfB
LVGTPAVTDYYRIRELAKQHKEISLAECICRKEKRLLDKGCEHPLEACLSFGVGARYYIDQGKGRPISTAEALEILDRSEADGLVLMPNNSKDIMSICSCCGCCCGVMRSLKMQDRPADHVRSGFRAVIDTGACSACAVCLERCPMDAISDEGKSMRIDTARCIGCGLCTTTCDQSAISLSRRTDAAGVPTNYFHMLSEMAAANGAGFGKLSPALRWSRFGLMVKGLPLLYKSGLGKPVTDLLARRGII